MAAAAGSGDAHSGPQLDPFYHLTGFDELGSTNEEARRVAEAGAPEGELIWSRMQGAGRGRRGRVWSSPLGNLYTSLVLRPDCAPYTAAQISFVSALAIHDVVASALNRPDLAYVKWPNDVLIEGRKTAGILLESRIGGGPGLEWLIVGVGINILSHPDDAERPATSLHAEGGGMTVEQALVSFSDAFLRYYREWQASGFAPIRETWLARARGLGEPIDVRLDKESFSGIFEGLDENGALQVQTEAGMRIVTAGDVFSPTGV